VPDKPLARPVRLFLDANILISGLLFEGPEHRVLALADERRFVAVVTDHVLWEVRRLLVERFGLSASDAADAVGALCLDVAPDPDDGTVAEAERLLRDPEDAPVLAAAWEAGADALVTGDKDLHAAQQDRVRVVRTAEALAWVASAQTPEQTSP
jgi:putative PIN family toxin of toxin-antitoxin system